MALLLTDYTVELGDDSNLTITKSIYDVIEPDKRKSGFTKTITIPSTAQNDKVFASQFDVNLYLDQTDQFAPFFNPTKKAPCYIHTEDDEQLTGYAQLTDIVINRGKIEYKLTVYGENRDLFATLSDLKLSDLDLSMYNHDYTQAVIEDSWGNNIYINGSITASSNGTGYVYPMVDYGDNHLTTGLATLFDQWKVTHFRPFIFVKTIVDRIFQEAGYSYYSNFFNSALFKKLIYQGDANGLTWTKEEIEDRTAAVYRNGDQSITYAAANSTPSTVYSTSYVIFNAETLDVGNINNTTTGVITIADTALYNLRWKLTIELTNGLGVSINLVSTKLTIAGIKSTGEIAFSQVLNGKFSTSTINAGLTTSIVADFSDSVGFDSGEQLRICIVEFSGVYSDGTNKNFNNNSSLSLTIKNLSTFVINPDPALPVGGTVSLSQMLNPDMTQKDFLMNLVKMFNLYIEPYNWRQGDANSGQLYEYLIEPRDDYYTSDVVDWTNKLDTEKDFTIKPVALSQYKYYHFTYKDDNDLLNDRYKGETGRIYGDYIHYIDNDFAKETKKIEIGFSPCIVSDSSNKEHWSNRVIPVNRAINGGLRVDSKPKILFWQGLGDGTWFFEGDVKTQIPYAGQLDDQTAPTCDLNFKVPPIIYYGGDSVGEITLTDATLFNKYYYRAVEEINNVNSKLIECYIKLSPSDIHNLSFRPLYFIDNAYYRLYEVVDHNYRDTTLCRFLKLTDVTGITGAVWKTRGGRGVFGTLDDKLPNKAPLETGGAKTGDVTTGKSGGVVGTGTTTGGYTDGILASNVLQAGTSKGVILKDNVVDIGYQYLGIASGTTELNGQEGSPLIIIVDTSGGSTVLKLPYEDLNEGKHYIIVKSSGSNTLSITDPDDVPIETVILASTVEYFLTATQYIKLR